MKNQFLLIISFLLWTSVAGQNIQTFYTETWVNDNWQKMVKGTNTYDKDDFLTITSQNNWDTDFNIWDNSFQTFYINNKDGAVTQQITQAWDFLNRNWYSFERITYDYNSNKKLSSKLIENWVKGNWQNVVKDLNNYDSIGNLINSLRHTWDLVSLSWKNTQQINFTNSSSGKVIEKVTQSWENLSNVWSNNQRITFTYNIKDKPLTQYTEIWVNGNWQNFERHNNSYDNTGFVINTIEQKWNLDSSRWNNSEQINYANNLDGTIHQKTMQTWDNLLKSWNNIERTTFTYNQTSDTYIPRMPSFSVYPNPSKDIISIKLENSDLSKVSIIDLNGKLLVSHICSVNEFSININELNPSIYLVRIEQGEKIMIRKFIKN